ncbi:S41 family peptidase [Psychrobacillus sp. FSL K6-1267]|uniref:S41 family peptidase n=1 Tax=Psychrobacillus sp. FSL K6-1267 TaxID=2921543 RepID=UPI0030F793E5
MKILDEQEQRNNEEQEQISTDASKYIKMKPFVLWIMIFTLVIVSSGITSLFLLNNKDEGSIVHTENSQTEYVGERAEFTKLYLAYDKLVKDYYKEIDQDAVINGAINGMIDALEDPYSEYMNQDEASMFDDSIHSSFQGIGAEIQEQDGTITVVSPIKNSPAEKAGLLPNDKVLKVDGKDIQGYSVSEAVLLIRGKKGTEVTLSIQRGDSALMEMKIVRDDIPIETVYAEMLSDNVAHIIISSFSDDTYDELVTAIEEMEKEGMEALVLDVRQNPGGLLDSAVDISNLFIEEGKNIVQIETKTDKNKLVKEPIAASPGLRVNIPVTILIDEGSASASEILAGALSESSNVPIVGVNSFGKGTVQSVNNLPDGSNIKITTAKWLTPEGNWIHDKGIAPDYEVAYPSYAMLSPLNSAEVLKSGMTSEAVQNAKEMLKAVGYEVGKIDSSFNDQMVSAVKKFQSDNKLETTGEITGETAYLLMDKLREKLLNEDPQLSKAEEVAKDLIKK